MTRKTVIRLSAGCLAFALAATTFLVATRDQRSIAQEEAATPEPTARGENSPEADVAQPDSPEAADGTASTPMAMGLAPEETAIPKSVEAMLKTFFYAMQEARVLEAFSALLQGSRIGTRPDDVTMLQDNGKRAIAEFGPIRSFELLDVRRASPFLIRLTYVSAGRDAPLRWRFYFYNGEGGDAGWRLLDLRVDDQIALMFDANAADALPVEAATQELQGERGPADSGGVERGAGDQ